jgi:uncharacterized protein YbjT (DUF2867 family)
MKENIVVIGGTGKTGRKVVEGLTELGHNVRIGSRNGTPKFHWEDPTTYALALEGMDKAYIVFYPDLAVPTAKKAISDFTETALQKGLEKVVLLSGKGEKNAEECEEIVACSGLNYTIVRASWFNQNFSESLFLPSILAGHVALPMPEAQIPFVDVADIAEVAIKALTDDSFNGQTLTVTGPRKLTFEQAVQTIAQATNREIKYEAVSLDDFTDSLKQMGLPNDVIWLFGYLFEEVVGNPNNQEVFEDVEKVLGRKAIDFAEYVEKATKTGVWYQAVPQ